MKLKILQPKFGLKINKQYKKALFENAYYQLLKKNRR